MSENLTCYECGSFISRESSTLTGAGDQVCRSCTEDFYFTCDQCGETWDQDLSTQVNDGASRVCEDCAEAYYYRCDSCGYYYSRYNTVRDNFTIVCDGCFSESYHMCNNCEAIIHDDYTHYDSNGTAYCDSCFADVPQANIHDYYYTPIYTLYGDRPANNRYYGVELEIDDGEDLCATAADLYATAAEIYLKQDGSLVHGVEIVTHPCTLSYHADMLPWKEICHVAQSYGYKSHDVDTCGLHIHVSRAGFGDTELEQDLTIAKLMLLFDKYWDKYIVPFSRRDHSKINAWAKKPDAGISTVDTPTEVQEKIQYRRQDRYQAINITNSSTVEFRIFRGTLKHTTILASLQWIDTLINFCQANRLKDFIAATWDTIFADTLYPELRTYLSSRKLYPKKGDDI